MELDQTKPQDLGAQPYGRQSINRDRQEPISRNASKSALSDANQASNRASRLKNNISFEEKELTRIKESVAMSTQKSNQKGFYDAEDQL